MKFKKGKLYRVVKDTNTNCKGCILKYEGISKFTINHIGKCVSPEKRACFNKECVEFQNAMHNISNYKLVEHESMVDFCKKLKKQRSK